MLTIALLTTSSFCVPLQSFHPSIIACHDAVSCSRASSICAVAPAFQRDDNSDVDDDALSGIRQSMTRLRGLRRKLRESPASAAMIAKAQKYEQKLAELDDMQRRLVRSTTATMLKERREAERKWREFVRPGRDDF